MASSTLTIWTGPFPNSQVSGQLLLLPCFIEITVLNANSVDPDQTPRSTASDLGLHCCQCPFYGTLGLNGLNITKTCLYIFDPLKPHFYIVKLGFAGCYEPGVTRKK